MATRTGDAGTLDSMLRAIGARLRATAIERAKAAAAVPHVPFVTISRQCGAGGKSLAEALVKRLNASSTGPNTWTSWDRELVEKVATDHHISQELIDAVTETGRS